MRPGRRPGAVTTAADAKIRRAHRAAYLRRMCPMIAALPPTERPRERLWSLGPAALTTVELLAILLGTGTGEADSARPRCGPPRGRRGSLRRVAMRPRAELLQIEGIGPGKGARPARPSRSGLAWREKTGRRRRASASPRTSHDCSAEAARSPGRVPPSRAGQPEPGAAPGPDAAASSTARWYIRGRSFGPCRRGGRGHHRGAQPPQRRPHPSAEDRAVTRQLAEAGRLLGLPL